MTCENNCTTNVLIVGTGGQGVITASEILSGVALESGLDAKKSEIHGMSQRGGVVTSHVRFGKSVASSLIMAGAADILLSFELAESVRWVHFLKPTGRVITSLQKIVPPAVSIGNGTYPDNATEILQERTDAPILVDAQPLAIELGNPRLVNTILLGIMSNKLDLSVDQWKAVVARRVPPKFKGLNMVAFDKGREIK